MKKHGGKKKAKSVIPSKGIQKGQWYMTHNCKYLINERRMASRIANKHVTILLQEVKEERARKQKQMAIIFHLLQRGRPMLEYETMRQLLQFLECPKLSLRHWFDNSGWTMTDHMNMYIVFCIYLNALATFSNVLSFFWY